MQIYDISMKIHENMTVYKNNPKKKPKLTVQSDYRIGSVYESELTCNLHTGTHIDAPLHMIEGGTTIDAYLLSDFIGKCKVFDFTALKDTITAEDLKTKDIAKGDFILLKTRNSFTEDFDFEFVYVNSSAAEYLSQKEIRGVGIDALGIERSQPNHSTHRTLLQQGIIILEGLRLKDIEAGEYTLICLPLKIDQAEASMVRAVLIKE